MKIQLLGATGPGWNFKTIISSIWCWNVSQFEYETRFNYYGTPRKMYITREINSLTNRRRLSLFWCHSGASLSHQHNNVCSIWICIMRTYNTAVVDLMTSHGWDRNLANCDNILMLMGLLMPRFCDKLKLKGLDFAIVYMSLYWYHLFISW